MLLDPPSGLIIDAFGELRDQQEQVKEDMEVRFRSSQDHSFLYEEEHLSHRGLFISFYLIYFRDIAH